MLHSTKKPEVQGHFPECIVTLDAFMPRQYNKEVKGNVAAHMAHTERTADKHYHLTNSAFAARQLTAVMHGRSSPTVLSRSKNDDIEQPRMRKDDFYSPPEGKDVPACTSGPPDLDKGRGKSN